MKPTAYIGFILYLTFTIVTESISVSSAHSITRAEGEVRLEKMGTSELQITGAGETLVEGDILHPAKGAIVIVTCDSGRVCRVPDGVPSGVSCLCPTGEIPIVRVCGEVFHRPGGSDPQIPYVLHPRMTYLHVDRPILRWNGVKGSGGYTVRLHGPMMDVIWQKKVSSTSVQYPQSAPALDWGVKYLLTVEADNGRSSREDAGACYGFELLDEDDISEIRKKVAKIADSSDLNSEERALAAAYLYSNESLISDAIGKLETVVKQGTRAASIYRQLGGLYARVGLNLLSEDHYQKALELSEAADDRYGVAKTQAELAGVKLMLGKNKEARQLVDKAQKGYQQIGNFQDVRQIEEWWEKNKKPPIKFPIDKIITPRNGWINCY